MVFGEKTTRRIVLGRGGTLELLGPLAWVLAGFLVGEMDFADGDVLVFIRAVFIVIGAVTFVLHVLGYERWIFDLDRRRLEIRRSILAGRTLRIGFEDIELLELRSRETGGRGATLHLLSRDGAHQEIAVGNALGDSAGDEASIRRIFEVLEPRSPRVEDETLAVRTARS